MSIVTESVTVKAPIEKVFAAYVERIDEWWPRRTDNFRFTFAPSDVDPLHIRFEPQAGGRLYETFANGDEFVIGRITDYQPPQRLAYTWQDPDWPAETLVEIEFAQSGDQTTLSLRHSGFEKLDAPGMAAGYQQGSKEIYAIFKTWLEDHLVEA